MHFTDLKKWYKNLWINAKKLTPSKISDADLKIKDTAQAKMKYTGKTKGTGQLEGISMYKNPDFWITNVNIYISNALYLLWKLGSIYT